MSKARMIMLGEVVLTAAGLAFLSPWATVAWLAGVAYADLVVPMRISRAAERKRREEQDTSAGW